ncbi:MAG: hypothetical protein NXY57DRAFT_450649 [Lentinula lateritia]|nr:MAG: hypothetical protein NXY57DRAFT_450649 [Lentinula lateritia]
MSTRYRTIMGIPAFFAFLETLLQQPKGHSVKFCAIQVLSSDPRSPYLDSNMSLCCRVVRHYAFQKPSLSCISDRLPDSLSPSTSPVNLVIDTAKSSLTFHDLIPL